MGIRMRLDIVNLASTEHLYLLRSADWLIRDLYYLEQAPWTGINQRR